MAFSSKTAAIVITLMIIITMNVAVK
jgi:hypothetical protein